MRNTRNLNYVIALDAPDEADYLIREFRRSSVMLQTTFGCRLRLMLKRGYDLVVSLVGLVLLSPLLAIIWFGIRLDSRGAAIFKAQRVGKHGQVFTMYKFRTMCVDAEARLVQIAHLRQGGPYMIKIPSDPRVTRFGRFLRRTSLDELPQLWNVVKGEMSLVGPRPQAPDEVALYNSRQRYRLEVTPGITGLWQVTARDIPDFEEWIRLDLQYIAGWSLWLDFKILLRTFGEVAGK